MLRLHIQPMIGRSAYDCLFTRAPRRSHCALAPALAKSTRKRALPIALALATIAFAAAAQTVVDGDTLKLNGAPRRLWGIDAPELHQACPDRWPAGRLSASRLQELVLGQEVICQEKSRDRYGRIVAICRSSGADVGGILVREGLAWAFTRYSGDYVGEEAEARTSKRGVHAHNCIPPWEWRAERRAVGVGNAPARH